MKFPDWILEEVRKNKKTLSSLPLAIDTAKDLKSYSIHTVCDEALCPNKGQCFNNKEATFLIMGDICTRNCGFCAVSQKKPLPLDEDEPKRIGKLAAKWGLKYAVFTSPTRDDLKDCGALHYAKTIKELKNTNPSIKTEPLIPDLKGNFKDLETILSAGPEVLSHNIETPKELYEQVRNKADYELSLNILKNSKKINKSILTKSSLIIGLGENELQLKNSIEDLKKSDCDILVIGQYLSPSSSHFPIKKFYSLKEFNQLKDFALSLKFKAVLSLPLARSSYRAFELYKKAINA